MSTPHSSISFRGVNRPHSLRGTLSVPGDKSISHRSLILNAIAHGDALVQGLSSGDDVLCTMHCLQAMGVSIEPTGQTGSYKVSGHGPQLVEPPDILDAGNSGTSMRLLDGVLASQHFASVSYTHLAPPTTACVQVPGVARSAVLANWQFRKLP